MKRSSLSDPVTGDRTREILIRGASGAFTAKALGIFAALGLQVFLARVMGVENFGMYIYVLTWVHILSHFSKLGMDVALIRFIPGYEVEKSSGLLRGILKRSDQIALLVSVGFSVTGAFVIYILQHRLSWGLTLTFLIGFSLLPFLTLMRLRQAALQSVRRVVPSLLPEFVLRPLLLAALVAFLVFFLRGPVVSVQVMFLELFVTIAMFFIAAHWQRKALPSSISEIPPTFATRQWLRISFVLLWVSQMQIILRQTDIVLIGILVGTEPSGVYAVASRMAQMAVFGLNACIAITAPMISEYHAKGATEQLQKTVSLTAWIATIFALAIGFFLILGRDIALGLFGKSFQPGSTVLIILVCGQLINALSGPVGVMLNMTGHQDANAKIFTCIALMNVLLNYPAILIMGPYGAALVTSGLIVVRNVWTWNMVRRKTGINSSIFRLRLRLRYANR